MKKITLWLTVAVSIYSFDVLAQVGIGTAEPEGVLDVVSDSSAVVLPRNLDPDGVDNVAGNDDDGVPNPVEGMMVYDKTDKLVKFYDGEKWQAFQVIGDPEITNEGVVKIESGGSSSTTYPSFVIESASSAEYTVNTYYQIKYDEGLNFADAPITSWPDNDTNPGESSIYNADTGAFYENSVPGQVHIWRVEMDYTKQGNSNYDAFVSVKFTNNVTGNNFVTSTYAAATNGVLSYNFITVAGSSSLEGGYTVSVKSTSKINLTVKSVLRVSTLKD